MINFPDVIYVASEGFSDFDGITRYFYTKNNAIEWLIQQAKNRKIKIDEPDIRRNLTMGGYWVDTKVHYLLNVQKEEIYE